MQKTHQNKQNRKNHEARLRYNYTIKLKKVYKLFYNYELQKGYYCIVRMQLMAINIGINAKYKSQKRYNEFKPF